MREPLVSVFNWVPAIQHLSSQDFKRHASGLLKEVMAKAASPEPTDSKSGESDDSQSPPPSQSNQSKQSSVRAGSPSASRTSGKASQSAGGQSTTIALKVTHPTAMKGRSQAASVVKSPSGASHERRS